LSEIQKCINQLIKLGFAEFLKAHKFKKSGRRWSKQSGGDWLLVGFQSSIYNRGANGKFTINLGIYNNTVEQLAKRLHYKEGATPKAEGATLETRLYQAGGTEKQWWEIGPETSLQSLSDEIIFKMEHEGLPWLMENNRIEVFENEWRNFPKSVVAFTTAYLRGNEQEARRRVKEAIETVPGGAQYAVDWAKRVGLQL
jgi:hypothetical protein